MPPTYSFPVTVPVFLPLVTEPMLIPANPPTCEPRPSTEDVFTALLILLSEVFSPTIPPTVKPPITMLSL